MTCGTAHHWVIGEPNGTPLLDARCKKCGAERTYPASPEGSGSPWLGDFSVGIIDPYRYRPDYSSRNQYGRLET